MIRLIQFLIFGHIHKWNVLEKEKYTLDQGSHNGIQYNLQCEKCGNMKRFCS